MVAYGDVTALHCITMASNSKEKMLVLKTLVWYGANALALTVNRRKSVYLVAKAKAAALYLIERDFSWRVIFSWPRNIRPLPLHCSFPKPRQDWTF